MRRSWLIYAVVYSFFVSTLAFGEVRKITQEDVEWGDPSTTVTSAGGHVGHRIDDTYVATFRGDSTGATDIITPLNAAIAAINTAGRGALIFRPGTYTLFADNTVSSPTAFSNCDGVRIIGYGATITEGVAWNPLETRHVFRFNNCKNVKVEGFKFTGGVQFADIVGGQQSGTQFVLLGSGTENVSLENIYTVGAGGALSSPGQVGDVRVKNVKVKNVACDNGTYCLTGYRGMDNLEAWIRTSSVYRSYVTYDTRDHVVHIDSLNPIGGDVQIGCSEGNCAEGITLYYTNIDSTSDTNSYGKINLTMTDGGATIKDIKLILNIKHLGSTGWNDVMITRASVDNTVVAGIDGLTISGRIEGSRGVNAYGTIGTYGDLSYTSNQSIRNLVFRDLVFDNVSEPIHLPSQIIKEGLTFNNVQIINSPDNTGVSLLYMGAAEAAIDSSLPPYPYTVINSTIPNQYRRYPGLGEYELEIINPGVSPITLTAGVSGRTITNYTYGIAQAWEYTLPRAVMGLWYRFVRVMDESMTITPNALDNIVGLGTAGDAGKYLEMDNSLGQTLELRCLVDNVWSITASTDNTLTWEP